TLAFAGTTPIGNFFAGSFTQKFGPGVGFMMCGLVTGFLIAAIIVMIIIKSRSQKNFILSLKK
ncbi:MAG: hypothetical protein K6T29_06985, partial [Peptococcaceae bacterium]|nr:hypothetical protein [Peptococcaceae bacterium]